MSDLATYIDQEFSEAVELIGRGKDALLQLFVLVLHKQIPSNVNTVLFCD